MNETWPCPSPRTGLDGIRRRPYSGAFYLKQVKIPRERKVMSGQFQTRV